LLNEKAKLTVSNDMVDAWCTLDRTLKHIRKLRWIGRVEEAEELLRSLRPMIVPIRACATAAQSR
jgi:hypothetical protein